MIDRRICTKLSMRPIINKKNGQITLHPKKSKLPKKLLDDIVNVRQLDFVLEDWK